MLEGLVLAAGASMRMGSAKAVLPTPDGRPFVVQILETLREAGLSRITIVTGVHHDLIVEACAVHLPAATIARCVRNPDPARGQLSSLITGMDAVVGAATQGLLVTLVDVPLVTAGTVRRLIETWDRTRAPVVRPVLDGRHGHPVIFDRQVFAALRATPFDVGARAVVRAHADRIENVPVDDAGCLVDVDTPDDYARLGRTGDS